MPTTKLPPYMSWTDSAPNARKPYVFQQNIGSTARVFRFRFEKNRDRELRRAKRLGASYKPTDDKE